MSVAMITSILGGIGLFLLGMIMMTDALKSVAGNTLRQVLSRFTGGKFTSILSGAGITAIIQSSHATTIATIGFVSAGILTFENSIGVIYGANLGTTVTGWLVSLLGLKLKFGTIALPIVGIGAAMRLLGRAKLADTGTIIAGFGLIFIGIDILQTGMKDLSAFIDLSQFAGTSIMDRAVLVGIGVVMTIIMQSSSAAVATTLTALSTGAINLDHAASLVIGQNIGTTITAALAGIGASVPAKRTVVAHVMFNVITGIVAFIILPVFIRSIEILVKSTGVIDDTIILSAFHTAFNILGVLLLFPFTRQFSAVINRFIPEKGPYLTRNLDLSITKIPAVALETVRRTVIDITIFMIDIIRDMIISRNITVHMRERLKEAGNALFEVRKFLGPIVAQRDSSTDYHRYYMSMLHAIDHINQLIITCWEFEKLNVIHDFQQLNDLALILAENTETMVIHLEGFKKRESLGQIESTSLFMKELRKKQREQIFERTSAGVIDPDTAMRQIEALRWLDRVTYRIWRALFYLGYHKEMHDDYIHEETLHNEEEGK